MRDAAATAAAVAAALDLDPVDAANADGITVGYLADDDHPTPGMSIAVNDDGTIVTSTGDGPTAEVGAWPPDTDPAVITAHLTEGTSDA